MTDRLTPEQLAEYCRQLFEVDKRGQLVLEELVRRFAQPAVTNGGIDAILQTYHRMGANAVMQFIVAQINRANGVADNHSTVEIDP